MFTEREESILDILKLDKDHLYSLLQHSSVPEYAALVPCFRAQTNSELSACLSLVSSKRLARLSFDTFTLAYKD